MQLQIQHGKQPQQASPMGKLVTTVTLPATITVGQMVMTGQLKQ